MPGWNEGSTTETCAVIAKEIRARHMRLRYLLCVIGLVAAADGTKFRLVRSVKDASFIEVRRGRQNQQIQPFRRQAPATDAAASTAAAV
jgi:hypothetical protein